MWLLTKRQHAVERRVQGFSKLGDYAPIAEIVLIVGLRFILRIKSQFLKIGTKDLVIEMLRLRGLYRAFLSEDVPKSVVEFLKFDRRWLDAAASAANPDLTVET